MTDWWPHDMTLADAVDAFRDGGPPCACAGPYPLCWCARDQIQAERLHRAAHIAVKQMAELRERSLDGKIRTVAVIKEEA